jgi:hypothetical protein
MSHKTRFAAITAWFIFISNGLCFAQDTKDPQSSYEPRSKPGLGQQFLEKMVGDWEVTKTFYPRSGAPAVTKGECRQTMIHGGRFLQSDFIFGEGESKVTGKGLIGYESDRGIFTSVWTDSRATRMSFRQSREKFNGEEIVLYSQALPAGEKDGRQSRTVTHLEENGTKVVHRQYNPTSDGKERLIMELLMTRKSTPAQR